MHKELVGIPYVAKRFGTTEDHAYYAAREGAYDSFMVRISPRRLRFDPEKIEAFIANGGVPRENDADVYEYSRGNNDEPN